MKSFHLSMKFVVPFCVLFLCAVVCTKATSQSGNRLNTRKNALKLPEYLRTTASRSSPPPKDSIRKFQASTPPSSPKVVIAHIIFNTFEAGIASDDAKFISVRHLKIRKLVKLFDSSPNLDKLDRKAIFFLKAIKRAVANYEQLVKALRKYKPNINYSGPILYSEVMTFTENRIDKNSLNLLSECLLSIKEFYVQFLKYFPSHQGNHKNIITQIDSNLYICRARRVLFDACLEMSKKTEINLSQYCDRCDFESVDLKPVIMKAAESNPKARKFILALADFADKSLRYFNKSDALVQLSVFANQMKSKFHPRKWYEFFQSNKNSVATNKGQLKLKNVAARKETIKKGVKKRLIIKNKEYQWENFVLNTKIGQGGQAVVYNGEYKLTKQPVAFKFFPATAKEAFVKEVVYMQLLNKTPFICRILYWKELIEKDLTDVSDQFYKDKIDLTAKYVLVMELAKFGTLSQFLESDFLKKTKIEKSNLVRKWMSQIVVAVQHMHAWGIIHRDLKTDNILLTDSGDIRVCDFGIAKRFKTSHRSKQINLRGTQGFIPPEISIGKKSNFSTDVFALGIIFYLLIQDYSKYAIKLVLASAIKFNSDAFECKTDAPKGAKELLKGMLNSDPKKRLTILQIMKSEYFNEVDWRTLGALENPLSIPKKI